MIKIFEFASPRCAENLVRRLFSCFCKSLVFLKVPGAAVLSGAEFW